MKEENNYLAMEYVRLCAINTNKSSGLLLPNNSKFKNLDRKSRYRLVLFLRCWYIKDRILDGITATDKKQPMQVLINRLNNCGDVGSLLGKISAFNQFVLKDLGLGAISSREARDYFSNNPTAKFCKTSLFDFVKNKSSDRIHVINKSINNFDDVFRNNFYEEANAASEAKAYFASNPDKSFLKKDLIYYIRYNLKVYRLCEILDIGGQGIVYKLKNLTDDVEDNLLVKVITENPGNRDKHDFQTTVCLNFGIVYSVFTDEIMPDISLRYSVMPNLGETLHRRLENKKYPLSFDERILIIIDFLNNYLEIFNNKIAYGDCSLSNVVIDYVKDKLGEIIGITSCFIDYGHVMDAKSAAKTVDKPYGTPFFSPYQIRSFNDVSVFETARSSGSISFMSLKNHITADILALYRMIANRCNYSVVTTTQLSSSCEGQSLSILKAVYNSANALLNEDGAILEADNDKKYVEFTIPQIKQIIVTLAKFYYQIDKRSRSSSHGNDSSKTFPGSDLSGNTCESDLTSKEDMSNSSCTSHVEFNHTSALVAISPTSSSMHLSSLDARDASHSDAVDTFVADLTCKILRFKNAHNLNYRDCGIKGEDLLWLQDNFGYCHDDFKPWICAYILISARHLDIKHFLSKENFNQIYSLMDRDLKLLAQPRTPVVNRDSMRFNLFSAAKDKYDMSTDLRFWGAGLG